MTPEYRHTPVLLNESIEGLDLHPGSVFLDCTLGGAGHSHEAACRIAPNGVLIGIDQDDAALERATTRLADCPLEEVPILMKGNFGDLDELLSDACVVGVDAVLFDLGVSSPQFDVAERGFSYRSDGPLDMRMDPGSDGITAAEIVQTYSESDLADILTRYGEERWASRIAQRICEERAHQPIETTGQLADIVKEAIPAASRRSGGHPAKRTFQALRIAVNDELGVLERGLEAALRWLNPHGRIAVISYHSLEDRIVKETFRQAEDPCTCPPDLPVCTCGKTPVIQVITRKPITASAEEV
ncbi:MAG: 16S rRNA (cytosine(1402)-N(4))-methyltransferase RsmH, partial [Coriobacteriaceae bacterium]|nr:16S rRNA (cytosine(1402)-N(4))-methyltransferase RsmH [Coriobacteriaceae bacterium]